MGSRWRAYLCSSQEAIGKSRLTVSPMELDLAGALRSKFGGLDHMLGVSPMVKTRDGKLQRDVNIYLKAGLDFTTRFYRPDNNHDRLVFEYQGTIEENRGEVRSEFIPKVVGSVGSEPRYDYGSGTSSLFSLCTLGRFQEAIGSDNVTKIHISSCAIEGWLLPLSIRRLGTTNLRKLALTDIHIYASNHRSFFDSEKGSAWPVLAGLDAMLDHNNFRLLGLVTERVFFHVQDGTESAVIVDERREWEGERGATRGLQTLMSEMTSLDDDQKRRWLFGQIDSDGNAIVQQQ